MITLTVAIKIFALTILVLVIGFFILSCIGF